MERYLIELPSVRDTRSGYDYLFKIAREIIGNPIRYFDISFKNCSILDQNAVAILGGLANYVKAYNRRINRGVAGIILPRCKVEFQVDTMSQLIKSHLIQNNFLAHFSEQSFDGFPTDDYIGYRQHMDFLDANDIALHLSEEWLSDEKILLSSDLKNAIVSKILEIFMNAYGHGVINNGLGIGVVSCGQYFKKDNKLKLTVVDFGCGIVENVRDHLGTNISDESAMQWALEIGNSTKTDSIDDQMPRGLGFQLLSDFVTINTGELNVYSNSCLATAKNKGVYSVSSLKTPFSGTVVSISINCDGRYYRFISDRNEGDQYF